MVPEQGALMDWARAVSLPGTFEQVCASHLAKQYLLQQLGLEGRAAKVKVSSPRGPV